MIRIERPWESQRDPASVAVPIDKEIPFPQAVLVGCGVTTRAGTAINTARGQPGTITGVSGAGGMGLHPGLRHRPARP